LRARGTGEQADGSNCKNRRVRTHWNPLITAYSPAPVATSAYM